MRIPARAARAFTFNPFLRAPGRGRVIKRRGRAPRALEGHEIDIVRPVYLFLHGRMDLHDRAMAALTKAGFSASMVQLAVPTKAGERGDYAAMAWRPPNPDHIRVQKITAVEGVEPVGMEGVWRGVKREDLFEVPL